MRQLLTIFLLLFFTPGFAEDAAPANSQLLKNTTLKELKLEQVTLPEAIDALRKQTQQGELEVNFVIPPETLKLNKVVSLELRGVSGLDALAMILRQTGTRAELKQNSIWILPNPILKP